MSDLTVDEIVKEKIELEDKILELVQEFEKKIEIQITNISFDNHMDGEGKSTKTKVFIDAQL